MPPKVYGVWDMQLLKDKQEAIVTFALGNDCFIALPTGYANLLYMLAAFVILENKNSITGGLITNAA